MPRKACKHKKAFNAAPLQTIDAELDVNGCIIPVSCNDKYNLIRLTESETEAALDLINLGYTYLWEGEDGEFMAASTRRPVTLKHDDEEVPPRNFVILADSYKFPVEASSEKVRQYIEKEKLHIMTYDDYDAIPVKAVYAANPHGVAFPNIKTHKGVYWLPILGLDTAFVLTPTMVKALEELLASGVKVINDKTQLPHVNEEPVEDHMLLGYFSDGILIEELLREFPRTDESGEALLDMMLAEELNL